MDENFMQLPHVKTTGSFLPGTLPPSTYAGKVFIDVATKNKAMYKQIAKKEEAKIQKDQV